MYKGLEGSFHIANNNNQRYISSKCHFVCSCKCASLMSRFLCCRLFFKSLIRTSLKTNNKINQHGDHFMPKTCDGTSLLQRLLMTECTTGVQPHPAPEPNPPDWGQVRLLQPALNPTASTHTIWICKTTSN